MKQLFCSIRHFIDSLSLRHTIECTFITFGVCALILTGTVVLTNQKIEHENGQGGFETPGIPIVTESDVLASQAADESDVLPVDECGNQLSYMVYRVKKGDMIGWIAEQFNVTQDTIISVNNIRSSRLLQIGTYLKIPTMPGILYTVKKDGETISSIAAKYNVDADKCAAVNMIEGDSALSAGAMVFVADAFLDWTTRQEINGDLFKKPIRSRWYCSSHFGWRASPFTGTRSYHSGVDMACAHGTDIYAAMEGTVESTGFNNVYGNYVIIRHHSGYKTLYGHMSAILCKRGWSVKKNTVIGKVGNTGMSTGPHLHFTVFKNGKQVNPENLWG